MWTPPKTHSIALLCALLIIGSSMILISDFEEVDAVGDIGSFTSSSSTNSSSSSGAYSTIDCSITNMIGKGTFYVLDGASIKVTANSDYGVYSSQSTCNDYGIYWYDNGMFDYGGLEGTVSGTGSFTLDFNGATINVRSVEPDVSVTGIDLSYNNRITETESTTITATISPSDATNKNVTWEITWNSSYGHITSTTNTSTGGTCTIYGDEVGYIEVTATSVDNPSVTATATINISERVQYGYYVYYHDNYSDDYERDVYYAYDTTSTLSFSITSYEPTRTGYTFNGWSEDSGAVSPTYTAGDTAYVTYSDLHLYAVWVKDAKDIVLSFSANGGSGAPSSITKTTTEDSETFTIPSKIPTRSGYQFKGWSTSKTATSASYVAGNTITLSADKTLYAVWSLIISISSTPSGTGVVGDTYTYTVSTNVSGATVSVSGASWLSVSGSTISGKPTASGTYNITVTVTKSNCVTATQSFTITAYSALGFNTAPSASGIFAYLGR